MLRRVTKALLFATFACTAAMPALAIQASLSPYSNALSQTDSQHIASMMEDATISGIEYDSESLLLKNRLRSAFLIRLSGDSPSENNRDAGSLREELRQHFDAICKLLQRNTAQSLEIAVARLEKNEGANWTAEKRLMWRRQLSEERKQNIARLKTYRDRGTFPLNEGHANSAVPIFVDRHDTACAVGHLMRCSGWHREVEAIATANLLVYVTDVQDGPLRDWVIVSGLTQEEAALIQPGYTPPKSTTPMSELSGTGASVTADAGWFDGATLQTSTNGIVYENFLWGELVQVPFPGTSFLQSEWIFQTPDSSLTDPSPQDFGTRTDFGGVNVPDCGCGYSPNWPYANILTVSPDENSFSVVSTNDTRYFWMSFDMVSPDPLLAMDRVGVWFGVGFNFGAIAAETFVVAPSTIVDATLPSQANEAPVLISNIEPLGSLSAANSFFNGGSFEEQGDSVVIEPINRVTVHTLVSVGVDSFDPAHLGGMSHTVRLVVVPEPSSIFVVSACFLCCVGLLRRCDYRHAAEVNTSLSEYAH